MGGEGLLVGHGVGLRLDLGDRGRNGWGLAAPCQWIADVWRTSYSGILVTV